MLVNINVLVSEVLFRYCPNRTVELYREKTIELLGRTFPMGEEILRTMTQEEFDALNAKSQREFKSVWNSNIKPCGV